MKPYKLIFLFIILFASVVSKGQTFINGIISTNATWTVSGSPYIITGNTILDSGITLILEPGVNVKFDSLKTLRIDGELIAIGTANNRILFTSNQSTPAAGDWGYLHFSPSSDDAVFDNTGKYILGSIMKYCEISYGGGLGPTSGSMIFLERASPYISNCRILNSKYTGIVSKENNLRLDSSIIKNCITHALGYTSTYSTDTLIKIASDTIEGNGGGIMITASFPYSEIPVIVENCYFISNGTEASLDIYERKSIKISNNYFINNSLRVQYGAIKINWSTNYNIECNHFINNNGTDNGTVIFASSGHGVIQNNFFENNINVDNGSSVAVLSANVNSPTYFVNNVVINNTSSSFGACCEFIVRDGSATSIFVSENDFINNSGKGVIKLDWIGNSISTNPVSIKKNNFINPNSQYELYNQIENVSVSINADSNYWGNTNVQHVDSVIFDFFDSGNLSQVFYQPMLSTPVNIDTSCVARILIDVPEIIIDHRINSTVFPNPFSNQTQIVLSNEIKNGTLYIYNVLGKMLKSQEGINGREIMLDRMSLSEGIYFYFLLSNEKTFASGEFIIN